MAAAVRLSSRHPTELACLQELLKRLQDRHVDCAEALTKKAAADAQAAAAVSEDTPSVLEAMMLFQQVKKRAQAAQDRAKAAQDQVKAAKKVALEAEKDNDTAQKEVQELQRVMEPKRARTNATTANDHEECDEQSSDDMDIADYRRGHGKGPWDGLSALAKTKVTRDLTDGNVQTPSGRITSPLEVAQHLRAQFCSRQWKKERMNMKINQVVVMYLDADEIVRPARAQWSTEEDAHMRPGHHWLCEFGDVGNVTSCERQFNLGHHQCEDYRGTRFYN
jgi:hypothetical protein